MRQNQSDILFTVIGFLVRFLGTAGALILVTKFVPGFTVDSFYIALVVAVILGVLNITIKPILSILTLPLNIITLGLFSFVINAVLLILVSSFVEGFEVTGFVPALIGSVIIAVAGWVLHRIT